MGVLRLTLRVPGSRSLKEKRKAVAQVRDRLRAKKTFSVSAIEAGTALSLSQSLDIPSVLDAAVKGNFKGALTSLESNALKSKSKITATLAGAFVAKALSKGFTSGTLAKFGPIRIRA